MKQLITHGIAVTGIGSVEKTKYAVDLLFNYREKEKGEIMIFDISPKEEIPADLLKYQYEPYFKSVPSLADVLRHVEEFRPSGIVVNNIHFACKQDDSYILVLRRLNAIAEQLDRVGSLRGVEAFMVVTGREETEGDTHNNDATQAAIDFCGERITLGPKTLRTFLVPEDIKI